MIESSAQSTSDSFSRAWRSLAHSRWLPFALLALGTASNGIYAHIPLVAFAVVSGLTLPRQRAIATTLLIWLLNQSIGFGLRGYPLTATAFTWGALMGLGALLVVAFVSWRPMFARTTWVGHGLWIGISFLIGFGLYQGIILLVYPMMTSGHLMDWAIVTKLFIKQGVWTITIALAHGFFLWRQVVSAQLAQS